MADKKGIQQNERWETNPVDPVYSLAENVRKVAGDAAATAHEQENEPEKKRAKTEKAAKQKNTAAEKTAKTKTPAKKTAHRQNPRLNIVSKKKETVEQKQKAGEKEEQASAAPADAESGEDEFVEIRPDFFWKLSTIVLAILVLWSYFFR